MKEVIYRRGDCEVRDTMSERYPFYQVYVGGVCDLEVRKDSPKAYKRAWQYCHRVANERMKRKAKEAS